MVYERNKRPETADARRIDALFYGVQLDDLINLASEICLVKPAPDRPYVASRNPEAAQVQHLGLRGVQAALMIQRAMPESPSSTLDCLDAACAPNIFEAVTHLTQTEYMSDGFDPELIHKVTLFGEAIMRDSYRVLGGDADSQVAKLRAATTPEAQYEVIEWLSGRLRKIADTSKIEFQEINAEGTIPQYHPIRLSPKAIGQYPTHNLPPTCLSVSIIACEFLKRAGVEQLHAGVMTSLQGVRMQFARGMVDVMRDLRHDQGDETLLDDALKAKSQLLTDRYSSEEAFHVVAYAKLLDDKWAQIDSNFSQTDLTNNTSTVQRLNAALETLQEMSDIAPALELPLRLFHPMSLADAYFDTVEKLIVDPADDLRSTMTDMIAKNERESFAQRLYDQYVEPIVNSPTQSSYVTYAQEYMQLIPDEDTDELYILAQFHRLFDKFALWDRPIDEVLDRCERDESFRDRFIADTAAIIPIVFVQAAADESTRVHGGMSLAELFHGAVEVGVPETRIGFSVLSNFAGYCGSDLPPSFWLNHWPSQVSIKERSDDDNRRHQLTLLWNNAITIQDTRLTYQRSDAKVNLFIDQQDDRVHGIEVKHHGEENH